MVKWSITDLSGQNHERRQTSWLRGGLGYPSGETVVWKPGEARIVSPMFNLNESRVKARDMSRLFNALASGPLAKEVNRISRVEISLIAAVYDDGLCESQKQSDSCDRYENERNGERDEAATILEALNLNLSDDQIAARLNEDIAKSQAADGNDISDSLEAARGREARILLSIFKRHGRTHTWETAQQLARYPTTTLRKVNCQ
jgi:hypothetical protein